MDIKTHSEEASVEELSRELLIAISRSVPEEVNLPKKKASEEVVSLVAPESLNSGNGAIMSMKSDEDDKLRSELISISYVQSPDVGV